MQMKKSVKIITVVTLLVVICLLITYAKSANTEVLATQKIFYGELQENEYMHIEEDESGDKTKEEILNSKSWGNYKDSTFEYIDNKGSLTTKEEGNSERIPTGSSEYTIANNIYDLAGNVYEWTVENHSTHYRTYRGGAYDSDSRTNYVSNRYGGTPTSHYEIRGCRAMLYIK